MANQIGLVVLVNFLIVLAIYFLGGLLLKALNLTSNNKAKNNFISLLAGYTILVTIISIVVTKGVTSFIALLPILLYLLKTKKENSNKKEVWQIDNLKSVVIALFSFTTVTTLLQFFIYTGFNKEGSFIPEIHNDYIFYSNVSAHILQTGHENYYLNSTVSGLFLYHYSEMYLTIFAHFLKGGAFIQNYLFGTMPILFTLVWYGFYSIAITIWSNRSSLFLMVFSACCFFLAPIREFVYPFQHYLAGDVYDLVFTNYYKLAIILLFAIGLYHTINNATNRTIILLTLGIVYPTILPAVLATLSIQILVDIIRKQRIDILLLICQLFVFVLLASMLYFFKVKIADKSSVSAIDLYIGNISEYIKTIINIGGSSVCKIMLTTLPITLLLFSNIALFKKNGLLFFIGFSLLLQAFGLLAWGLLFRMPDSVQLWFNIYLPVVAIIIYLVLIYAINDYRNWVKLFGWIFLLTNVLLHFPIKESFSLINNQQKDIINKIQSHPNNRFAFIKAPSEYNSIFDKNVSFGIIGSYLSYFNESYAPVCINTSEIPIQSEWEKGFVKTAPFSKWLEDKNGSLEKLQLDYIKENKIRFVLISTKANVPGLIKQNAVSILNDSRNNFRLIEIQP